MTKNPKSPPDLRALHDKGQYAFNSQLLEWLRHDRERLALYKAINADRDGRLEFPSRDALPRPVDPDDGLAAPLSPPQIEHRTVTLITKREEIEAVLLNRDGTYSSRVYSELGGGDFMLALDPAMRAHAAQRDVFMKCFCCTPTQLVKLSHAACQAASITALLTPEFDMAAFAGQAALRFVQKLMGYALADYPLLEGALQASYDALVYQVLGRHFVTDPLVIPTAQGGMGRLLARTSVLIDAYGRHDEKALTGCKDLSLPDGLQPVLERLGRCDGNMKGAQRAVIAMGAAIGTIGNVQAAACIAVKAMFDDHELWIKARKLAAATPSGRPMGELELQEWVRLIQGPLCRNPPIPFLPRLVTDKGGVAVGEVILALGGGTLDGPGGDDPLVWGLPGDARHWCAGRALAWPLIAEIVRQAMALPGLAECLDARDATPIGLKKRWGFACESYPLTHRRDRRIGQSSLNVAMRLKPPIRDSADAVRVLIRAGSPRIEEALRSARQVHFAWFELIEEDSVCVLHTVYDGPFDAYIQDFALKIGDVFDLLFEHIETAPPTPVKDFPEDFVALIQRFNRPPAMGYFFTAYPRSDVTRIQRNEVRQA